MGTVIFLSARVQKLSVGVARALFFLYAALNGVVFSAYFLLFDLSSMILVFGATALFFGIMALLGYVLKLDFSKIRPFMFGGLLFLAAFWLLKNPIAEYAVMIDGDWGAGKAYFLTHSLMRIMETIDLGKDKRRKYALMIWKDAVYQ